MLCSLDPDQIPNLDLKWANVGRCRVLGPSALRQANLPPAAATPADVLTCVYPQVDLEVMRGAEGFATVGAVLG